MLCSFQSRVSLIRHVTASLLLAVVTAWGTTPASAQDVPAPPTAHTEADLSGQLSLRGTVGVPRGGLRDNISGLGGGIHLHLGGWIDQSPVMAGLDLGILNYGRTTDTVPFSSTVGPRVPIEVTTSNNVLETHLSLRLQPKHGRIRPYIEGLGGFKYLFTRTSLAETDMGDEDGLDDEITGSTNYDDFAFSGGAGAGLDIRVYQPDDPKADVRTVSLHLGVQYLFGQRAEYLAEGALVDENGDGQLDRSELDVRRSRTTFLQPQFGLTFQLNDDR